MNLNLLTYNIRFGGVGRETLLQRVIGTISSDLVIFQEATVPSVIESLAHEAGYPFWAARANHSIAYISRIEIAHHQWHYLPGAKHSFLEIVVAGTESRIFGLHLSAIFSKWTERRRAREIRALLEGIKHHSHGFHVLLGDFNTVAPGEVLDTRRMPAWIRGLIWLSGRQIQRETIQIMLDAQYADGFRFLHPEERGWTFPTADPHLRLDYLFLPTRYAQSLKSCEVMDNFPDVAKASDHFPVLSRLEFE